jgi:beta-glucosidase
MRGTRLAAALQSLAALLLTACSAKCTAQYQYPFQNPNFPVEQRVDDLVSRLTLAEKIACLGSQTSVSRLGITGTAAVEGLHGEALGGPANWQGKANQIVPTTQFPQARGLGHTWDPALVEEAAAVEGYEARYAFQSRKYHRGGLIVRAPVLNLARDPRWGRNEESYGEGPFLVGTLGVAFIRGLQGDDPRYWQTVSLMKHFLAYSNEDGRGGSSSNFGERLLHEYYAVPFRMGVEEGHADALMTAYTAWNGIPMAVQPILRSLLMKKWGFNGIICTDAGALIFMVTAHHYYPNLTLAAAGAIHAGINDFLDRYKAAVLDAYNQHLITPEELDDNLKGVFRVIIRLGLLDPAAMVPYSRIGTENLERGDPWDWPAHKDLARKVTDESIVLLKNDRHMLPLNASRLQSIAVIGPFANQVLGDWYGGTPPYVVSPLEGIRRRAGADAKVQFATGNDVQAAVDLARSSDVVIAVVGNNPTCNAGWDVCNNPSEGKEAIDRKSITLTDEPLIKKLFASNPRTIVVLNANFPYAINWTVDHVPAILEMTHSSEEEGDGLADVLFGDYDPAGRLTETWPRSIDQLPSMTDYDIRDGDTYMYFKGKPLYAFGHGLSYTTFAYSNLRLSSDEMTNRKPVTASVYVTNTGSRAGDEVVQLYVKYPASTVTRPREELEAFQRISLEPHESKTVNLTITPTSLSYWDTSRGAFVLEHEPVSIAVGSSSDHLQLKTVLHVVP